ncbi:MAG: hypothetical protein AAFN74_17980, partial [Myxococcota bacterium]
STLFIVTLCAALLGSGFAQAQSAEQTAPPQARKRARQLAKEARDAYQAGRFEQAEGLIRGAYALDPAPPLLYNLATILDAKGDRRAALNAYRQFLRRVPNAKSRRRIERRIKVLKDVLISQAAPPARSPAPVVAQPAPVQSVETPRLTEKTTEGSTSRVLPWVVVSTGVLGLGAGITLGLLAQGKESDARDAEEQVEAAGLLSDAESFATGANILYAAGGAVLAGGLLWVLLGGEDEPDVSAVVTPDFVGAVGRF